jgi:hypothetical protein
LVSFGLKALKSAQRNKLQSDGYKIPTENVIKIYIFSVDLASADLNLFWYKLFFLQKNMGYFFIKGLAKHQVGVY